MRLKKVGFYKEFIQDTESNQSIFQVKCNNEPENKSIIAKYLREGCVLICSPGVVYDVFDKNVRSPVSSLSILTDGHWVWPEYLSYFYQKYNLSLPLEFLLSIKSNHFQCPHMNLIELSSLQIDKEI